MFLSSISIVAVRLKLNCQLFLEIFLFDLLRLHGIGAIGGLDTVLGVRADSHSSRSARPQAPFCVRALRREMRTVMIPVTPTATRPTTTSASAEDSKMAPKSTKAEAAERRTARIKVKRSRIRFKGGCLARRARVWRGDQARRTPLRRQVWGRGQGKTMLLPGETLWAAAHRISSGQ